MAMVIILVLIVVAAGLFHWLSPWWLLPEASNWSVIDSSLNFTLVVTGLFFIGINLFLALAIYRYRHRPGRKAAFEPHNQKLEWTLIVLTTIGIVALLAPGLFIYDRYVRFPEKSLVVEAIGQQWHWNFRFPGADGQFAKSHPALLSAENPFGVDPDDPAGDDDVLVISSELHLPVDQTVELHLRSKDVLHNFFVPDFRVKMDLRPGTVTKIWFTPTATGEYEILCAEYCGLNHFSMRGILVVESREDFQRWLQRHAPVPPAQIGVDSDRESGREIGSESGREIGRNMQPDTGAPL